MSSTRCGSRAPYATTGQQSGAFSVSRATKSSSRGRCGLSTSISSSSARRATGLAVRRLPRPLGASGRVTTATTSWSDATRASRAGTATSGVPQKTTRTRELYALSVLAPLGRGSCSNPLPSSLPVTTEERCCHGSIVQAEAQDPAVVGQRDHGPRGLPQDEGVHPDADGALALAGAAHAGDLLGRADQRTALPHRGAQGQPEQRLAVAARQLLAHRQRDGPEGLGPGRFVD